MRGLGALLWVMCGVCCAQDEPSPTLKGYVTSGNTIQALEVNGFHVLTTAKTLIDIRSRSGITRSGVEDTQPFLGEPVELYGKEDRKTHTLRAYRITFSQIEPREVDGSGIVDAVLQPAAAEAAGSRMVRADGYLVLIGPKVAVSFDAPASSARVLTTNLWASFRGTQRADGIVVADRIKVRPNVISGREDRMLTKADYDPEEVKKDTMQGTVSKVFKGIDPKQIPPYEDAGMQQRVRAIGERLIPRYQRDLPESDETKLSFEFQVVDFTKWKHDAHTLPNGIILVPKQVVERLQNDSQLAAVLADNIACALEKQTYRAYPGEVGRSATDVAGSVAGIFVPGLSLLTGAGTSVAAARALRLAEEQSGRVGLYLMKDAGFEPEQAPLAWWLLASGKPKDLASIGMPQRAAYLYEMLGRSASLL